MYENKKESTIILGCIIVILIFYVLYWCFISIKNIFKSKESFNCRNSSNSKRELMKKIYKSDEVLDPDEIVTYNLYDDECNDPDGDCGQDPDS